jgi:hypothetical protein
MGDDPTYTMTIATDRLQCAAPGAEGLAAEVAALRALVLGLAAQMAGMGQRVESLSLRVDILAAPKIDLGAFAKAPEPTAQTAPTEPTWQQKFNDTVNDSMRKITELLVRTEDRLEALENAR